MLQSEKKPPPKKKPMLFQLSALFLFCFPKMASNHGTTTTTQNFRPKKKTTTQNGPQHPIHFVKGDIIYGTTTSQGSESLNV